MSVRRAFPRAAVAALFLERLICRRRRLFECRAHAARLAIVLAAEARGESARLADDMARMGIGIEATVGS